MTNPKAYSYLRFSTPEQQQGDSTRRQIQLAQEYAAKKGLELDETLSFEDRGVSAFRGKNVKRGRLGEFLEAVETGLVAEGSYLLVENLDRLSRREPLESVTMLNEIAKKGIAIVTLFNEQVYTAESLKLDIGNLMTAIVFFARAYDESETKSRRLKESWAARRSNAHIAPITRKCPGWLKPRRRKFVVIEERAEIVRRIYSETLEGLGAGGITKRLNEGGVPVFGRGQRWHRSYITKILENESVIGTFTPHLTEYDGEKTVRKPLSPIRDYYPAIVDEDTYRRVQALKRTKAPRRGRHANSEVRNIFGGLLRCGKCGGSMTRISKGGTSEYLICTTAKEGAGCEYKLVKYRVVETAFLENADPLLEGYPLGDGGLDLDRQIADVEGGWEGIELAIGNLLETIQGHSSPAASNRLRELEGERERLETELRGLWEEKRELAGPLVTRRIELLQENLAESPLDRTVANALMRQVFTSIVLDRANGMLTFRWKHGGESEVMVLWPETEA